MSSETIVRYCSPTLAGLKTANLFTSKFESKTEMKEVLRYWNRILNKKGLRAIPLRYRNGAGLIYIYRPEFLSRDLDNSVACHILEERGYDKRDCNKCIMRLIERIGESDEFPHEIGLFLGYPPEDVCGFIENKAQKCKCVGCWKVYGDVEKAEDTFRRFRKCKSAYSKQIEKGTSIERLIIAK